MQNVCWTQEAATVSKGHEDDYEIVRPIGSGSFGQVFLVLHKWEQRQYVMKNIEMKDTTKEGSEETELEVELLKGFRHPNIVAYQDSFVNSMGHLCILMEYCEHGDIHSYLEAAKKAQRVPDEQHLLEWFIQITLALHALHTKKILHRDLNTQNRFLTGYRRSSFCLTGYRRNSFWLNGCQISHRSHFGSRSKLKEARKHIPVS